MLRYLDTYSTVDAGGVKRVCTGCLPRKVLAKKDHSWRHRGLDKKASMVYTFISAEHVFNGTKTKVIVACIKLWELSAVHVMNEVWMLLLVAGMGASDLSFWNRCISKAIPVGSRFAPKYTSILSCGQSMGSMYVFIERMLATYIPREDTANFATYTLACRGSLCGSRKYQRSYYYY